MVRADEEARALSFRQRQQRRADWERAREQSLQGNAASAKAVRDAWEPVLLANLEREPLYGEDDD